MIPHFCEKTPQAPVSELYRYPKCWNNGAILLLHKLHLVACGVGRVNNAGTHRHIGLAVFRHGGILQVHIQSQNGFREYECLVHTHIELCIGGKDAFRCNVNSQGTGGRKRSMHQ